MSLYGALFAGVSALNAQSQSMGMISDNIANVNTIGYKRTEASFESLVTTQSRSTAFSPGAVRASTQQRIDQQGIIQQSRSATDIALSGNGFFVVQNSLEDGNEPLYTRAGQFSENSQGQLVNTAGKYLLGWPLDTDGNIPAASADLSSLVPVDVAFLGGITRPTTQAEIGLNLDAEQTPYTYPLSGSEQPHFTRSFTVYDSLGEGQDLTMRFSHHTSPTSTLAGTLDVQDTANIFDDLANLNSTATFNSTVDISGTIGAAAPGVTLGDSFVIELNGETATIAVDPAFDDAALIAAINAAFTGTPASAGPGGTVQLDANTQVEIRSGGSQPISEANLLAMGFSFGTTDRAPVTFTVQTGAGPVQTVTISEGDSAADLVAQLNALTDVNAQFDVDGRIIIASDNFGDNLTIGGVGGALPQVSTAGFADLGLVTGTFFPPAAPTILSALENPANPQNWWELEIVDGNGITLTQGSINFNGDGSINAVANPPSLNLSSIDWGNGSDPQDITVDLTSFSQYAGDYNVVFVEQNGAELGLRTGVSIDNDGIVTARFSNGETADLYKLPIATFANANGLNALNGNVYQESNESGEFNLREAGAGGAGLVESGSLEASNVDLADEFSKMIVTQRAYSAGTKVINTSDQMLEELLRLR